MNIIDKIKLAWSSKNFVEDTIKEAKKMDTNSGKPGWKTSEFWIHLATQAGVLWGAVAGLVPAKIAVIVTVAGTAVYTIARTIAKAVSDIQAAKAETTTVTTTQPVTTVTNP